ncbi:site-specific integrase [Spongiactinospora sp. TRM90649]|uniref:tyrosine-type recombinase/integrase n=1 Tax=Spongiactinospora sp. TRM90649 TaxID=3031114 RepID=UPI0023F74795|nr:site-specific integrase [Spongiactinospora sp. TRM90649]MDF5751105.1 site-specific integrase [Spongiactinospora sp. TRM90649]
MSARPRRAEGVEYRKKKNGEVSYRVHWREGGRRNGPIGSYTFDDLDQAKTFRAALVANGYRDPYDNPAFAEMLGLAPQPTDVKTFEDVAEEYLRKLVNAERRTLAEYRRKLADHVYPAVVELPGGLPFGPLGKVPVDLFTDEAVQGWVVYMQSKTYGKNVARPYSAKTIMNIHGTVTSPVFEYGVRRRYLGHNPCRDVVLPERKGRTVTPAQLVAGDEIASWIACAYEVDEDTGDITLMLLATGLRWGELTALRVCDIDFEVGTLTVNQVIREDEDRQLYIETLEGKSPHAFRTIMLPATALRMLERRVQGRHGEALLFPAPGTRGGVWWRNANFREHRWVKVRAIAAERGLTKEPTIKAMRHSHASDLIPKVGLEQVSKRLGHANVTITSAVYSHLTPDADAETAKAIDRALSGVAADTTTSTADEETTPAAATADGAAQLPPEVAALLTNAIGQAIGALDLSALIKSPDQPAT